MARRLSQLAHLPVTELKGVGAKAAEGLSQAYGIASVLDLLTHYPRRWIDRTREARIADLRPGVEAMVVGEVRRISSRRTRGRPPRTIVSATVDDGSGRLSVTFFNQGWRERQLPPGTSCVLFGKVDTYQGSLQMTNPLVDLIGDQTGRLVPVYPQSDKVRITSQDVARWVAEVLDRAGEFAEPLPAAVRDDLDLVERTRAFHGIHRPDGWPDVAVGRKRLVFDELLRIQLALILRKRALERTTKGIAHVVGGDGEVEGRRRLVADFHARLPFPLTGAQRRVIAEITADLAGPHPMHRLLQGDVGAGKTLVALTALLVAVQGGHQGALMAPTEVLAEQHHLGVRSLLDGLDVDDGGLTLLGSRPVAVELLTARATAAERKRILAGLAQGEVDVVIGTHALIQEAVSFRSLGVIVVDEQHRFGVEQRAALKERSAGEATPDVLVMTATPIPRTAAMTVYGDLDVSVLDEMPPGRTPIRTVWVRTGPPVDGADIGGDGTTGVDPVDAADPEDAVWEAVRQEAAAGRQAYVVCPLIEGSEKLEVRSAQDTYDELTAPGVGALDGLRVELLHGRMASADKEAVMERFRTGRLDVLVATTVIEVGVDVPNATVMVVLDADRFGIAQLHQLRGRVGRGAHRSTCYLVAAGTTEDAEERLKALVRTNDGFELAEVDLDLRGEGTLMGERQKGRSDLKLASLRKDREWVTTAREVAIALVDADPDLSGHPLLADEVSLFLGEDEQDFLLKG